MDTSDLQSVKLAIIAALGLSKDALHVYVGLAVFLLTALALQRSLRSLLPWTAVVVVAFAGELFDALDDLRSLGHWRWSASIHDIVNTLFWPTALLLLSRHRWSRLDDSRSDAVAKANAPDP
jgi:hypothetical protein